MKQHHNSRQWEHRASLPPHVQDVHLWKGHYFFWFSRSRFQLHVDLNQLESEPTPKFTAVATSEPSLPLWLTQGSLHSSGQKIRNNPLYSSLCTHTSNAMCKNFQRDIKIAYPVGRTMHTVARRARAISPDRETLATKLLRSRDTFSPCTFAPNLGAPKLQEACAEEDTTASLGKLDSCLIAAGDGASWRKIDAIAIRLSSQQSNPNSNRNAVGEVRVLLLPASEVAQS
jgi:hypothetical protein